MVPIGNPETSVLKELTPLNNPEDRRMYFNRCKRLRSRVLQIPTALIKRLEGPGIESQWGEIFHIYRERLRGPASLLYKWYRVFHGAKEPG
jgi:hypothetical protein